MTTPHTARVLCLIAAAQARIAGMIAENQARAASNQTQAYVADHFYNEAAQLEILALDVINQ